MKDAAHTVNLHSTDVLKKLEELASEIIDLTPHGVCEIRSEKRPGFEDWELYKHLSCLKAKSNLDTEEVSQLFRGEHRVRFMVGAAMNLTKALAELYRELRLQLEPIAARLSRGVFSLPDDVLSIIFEFANPPGEGTRQAIWLSHVCRRFRKVTLDTCRLWTTLHSDATREELDALISRSGTASDLSIVISIPSAGGMSRMCIHSFMRECAQLASRWSIMTVRSESDEAGNRDPETVDEFMEHILENFPLVLPRLQEFRFIQKRDDAESGENSWITEKFDPSCHWVIPNLRSIVCDEYVPFPSKAYLPSLRSFGTSLSVSTEEYTEHFDDLYAFLHSEKSITDFNLRIKYSIPTTMLESLHIVNTVCDSLTSLTIHLRSPPLPFEADDLIEPLMASLQMPNLSTFTVVMELPDFEKTDDELSSSELSDLVRAFFPKRACHTKLSSLNIELTHANEKGDREPHRDMWMKTLTIPLNEIPNVTTLSVKTFCVLRFSLDAVDGLESVALRELRLHDREFLGVRKLNRTITSLKEVGLWDRITTLRVERCFLEDDFFLVLEEVGLERIFFVPRRRSTSNLKQ